MKLKYFISISLMLVFLMSIAGASAVEDANQTDGLGLSLDSSLEDDPQIVDLSDSTIGLQENGDLNETSASRNAAVKVGEDKLNTTLTVNNVVVDSGAHAEVVATLKDCYGNLVSYIPVKIVVGNLTKIDNTDKNGQLSMDISGLAPGEYAIRARSSGVDSRYAESKAYGKAIICTGRIDPTFVVPNVIVVGNSSDVVVATLKDSEGKAISDVNVKIVVGDLSVTAKTDAKGQVSLDISGLTPGEYKISARSSGVNIYYREAKATAKAIVSEDKLDTTLTVPNVIVTGNSSDVVVATLKDCYGNIVSDVNVMVVVGNLTKTAKTDAKGQVSMDLSGLAPGVYKISAKSSGVSDIYKEANVTANTIISKDKLNTTLIIPDIVENRTFAEIIPTLKDCYGNPVIGVKIKIVVGPFINIINTDFRGQFHLVIPALDPGEYNISARSSGVDSRYTESKAHAKLIFFKERNDTTLTVPDVFVVGNSSGVVVATLTDSEGNAVSDVNVKIVVGNLTKTDKTDANGQVSLDISGLDPGEYKISARSSGLNFRYKEAKATAKAIVSEDKLDTTLTLPDVFVAGTSSDVVVATLKDCYDNSVNDVNVMVVVGNLTKTVKTDANGQVYMDLSGLTPGEYKISARSSGVNPYYKEAKASAKAIVLAEKLNTTLTVRDVVVKRGSPAVVVATLKDCYGNTVSDVKVKIVVGDLTKTAKTDAKGQVSLDISGLAPGAYNVSARSSGVDSIYAESKDHAKAVIYTQRLSAFLTLPKVIVFGNSSDVVVATLTHWYTPISGVKVKVVVGNLTKIAKTDENGQVSMDLRSLAPGPYTISARSSGVSEIYEEAMETVDAVISKDMLDTTFIVPEIVINGRYVLVASLKDCYGYPIRQGSVEIVMGSLTINTTVDINGGVYLDIRNFAQREYTISARFFGVSGIYNEAKITSKISIFNDKLATTLTVPDVAVKSGSPAEVVATLKDCFGNLLKDINVMIVVGDLTKTAKTDANGQVSLDIRGLAPGEYTIYARSSGINEIYKEAKATAKAIVYANNN